MDKPPAAFGDLQLVHAADNRSGQLMWYIKRSVLFVIDTFLREYDKQARICAGDGVDHVGYLARLAELELIDRERRMVERRIKQARFPAIRQLESFDFKAIPDLNKRLVLDLARSQYITRRENIILLGPSGVGSEVRARHGFERRAEPISSSPSVSPPVRRASSRASQPPPNWSTS